MTDLEKKIHVLDAAYKPFPSFAEWLSRTSVDPVRWDRYKAELENKQGISSEALRRAYEVVKRAAALDTGAIEGLYEVDRGFTFTVAFETTAWEVQLAQKGEKVRSLFEAQMHAYDYVLDLATKAEPISEAAIRTLHEVVCRAQDTYRVVTAVGPQEQELVKGRYKVLSNHVRTRDGVDHSYAPVDVTPAEMQRFVVEMRGEAFLSAHPIMQAAYAHYALVVIHPFPDGNGRVARALASAFTYRAISMPIMILSEQKSLYLNSLETADKGEYQEFIDFILNRALDTIKVVHESLYEVVVPRPEEAAAAIEGLFVTRGGYTQDQVDNAGLKLFDLLQKELEKIISRFGTPNLRGNAGLVIIRGRKSAPDSNHRLPVGSDQDPKFLHIEFSSSAPAAARVYRNYILWLPKDAGADDDVQVMIDDSSQVIVFFSDRSPDFSARMDELIPSASGLLQIRIGLFVERIVGEMLNELRSDAEKVLRGETK